MSTNWILPAFLALLIGAAPASFAASYRYTDADGNIYYSGTIPPEQTTRGHSEINNSGVTVRTVPPKSEDADPEPYVDPDVAIIESFQYEAAEKRRELEREALENKRATLLSLQKRAADFERAGEVVPQRILERITRLKTDIKDGN